MEDYGEIYVGNIVAWSIIKQGNSEAKQSEGLVCFLCLMANQPLEVFKCQSYSYRRKVVVLP